MNKIDRFKYKYHFLSNFADCKVTYEGLEYPSTEAAYQAAKTLDPAIRKCIQEAETADQAKKLGKKIPLRPDWEQMKLQVMEDILRLKFNQPTFKKSLIDTGTAELIEGNTWKDSFWGVYKGKGENHLGKLLMKIRAELK